MRPMKSLSLKCDFALLGVVILLACSSESGPSSSPTASTTGGGAAGDGSVGAGGSTGGGNPGPDGSLSDGALPPVPIDTSRKVADLDRAERGTLCDWWQGSLGGYNRAFDCGGGNTVATATDQEECAGNAWPSDCTVTVAELEMCVRAQAPSHGCIRPRECDRIIAC